MSSTSDPQKNKAEQPGVEYGDNHLVVYAYLRIIAHRGQGQLFKPFSLHTRVEKNKQPQSHIPNRQKLGRRSRGASEQPTSPIYSLPMGWFSIKKKKD
jgi:hypothetical protein